MFDGLRARIERFLAEHTAPADVRASAAMLQDAVIEARVSLGQMKDGLVATERELAGERRQLEDAERRGRMAAELPDQETVDLAARYAARHRERVQVLERKLVVQREELQLAERDVAEWTAQLKAAKQNLGGPAATASRAWQDIEAAGGTRPETDMAGDLLRSNLDRAAHEAAAEAQLAHLKRKLGRDPQK